MNTGSKVYVVAGKFRRKLESQVGEVDRVLPHGGMVVTFRQGHDENARQDSYILAQSSLREVPERLPDIVVSNEEAASLCLSLA